MSTSHEDAALVPDQQEDEADTKQTMTRCGRMTACRVGLVVAGLLFAFLAVAMLAGGYTTMMNTIMKSKLELREGSQSYEIWRKTPFPLILKVYLFNITNADDFIKGAKPELQECGPYVWQEYHEKKNITFNANHTVTYFQQRWWVWDDELSGNNSRDDVIVTLNTVPVAATWAIHTSAFMLKVLDTMFQTLKEPAIVTTTAYELLFTGYKDPLLTFMKDHPSMTGGMPSYERFAWFYKRNESISYDGVFNMKTGVDSLENLGKIDWWNKTRNTPFFTPPCNDVKGSAGELFTPNQKKDNITLYSSDLCMSLTLPYKEEVEENGIRGYRYWGSNTTFANGSVVPGNECYCVKGTCAPTGLLNAESCRMGAPAFISFPHFFNADPFLLDLVSGLKPDEKKHAFYMDMIPELGTPMKVAARVQINLHVTPYKGTGAFDLHHIKLLDSVPDVYLPMLWFEELAEMPPQMAPSIKMALFMMDTQVFVIIWSVLLAASVLLVLTVIIDTWWKGRVYDPLLDPLM